MTVERVQRRLAAILAADVVGYSRLMGLNEAGTRARFNLHLSELIQPAIADKHGRLVKTVGDGLLVEFASVVDAVECAIEIQNGMSDRNSDLPEAERMDFRIGINLGDVLVEGDDIHGDGVNVAARLEGLANPGDICISRAARDQIRDKIGCQLEDMGEVEVKNIARPIRAFRIVAGADYQEVVPALVSPSERAWRRWPILAAAIVLVLVATVGSSLYFWAPWDTWIEPASIERMEFRLPDRPSIAVLPLKNISSNPDQDYFADGLTEDIVTDISKISGIFVVAHSSTMAYKGQSAPTSQVAEELGVRYVMTGSVRRAADELRVTAQLADAIRGEQIWAERYDRNVEDVFAIQTEITRQVVKALEVTLKASETDRVFQKHVTNIDAYDTFLRARVAVDAPTPENIARGETLFRQTIELDPDFAGGYAGLSFNYSVKARFRFGPSPDEDAARSLELAQKAIEIDNEFAWSHIALAGAHLANGNHDAAVEAVRRAVVIQPNGYEANLFMGFYLNFAGQSEMAVKFLEIANELGRVDTIRGLDFLAMAYFTDARYEACEDTWLRRFERLGTPTYPHAHVMLAACQFLAGKPESAEASVERFLALSPAFRMSGWKWIENYKLPEHRERLYNAATAAGIRE